MCAASSCSCPENNSNAPEVSRFLISAVTCAVPPALIHGSDIPCTDGGSCPCGDDGLRPDGFQLTLAFTVRRHTSSSWRSTFSQVRDVCCYSVWRFCSNKVSTRKGS
ncbi:hypothetical protein DPMN_070443 [Dreissena polymorpha]|uniref:Uncharacterized protein n=1 Tax=Dreissena polymorpha TaxID=45954 RepID=A0A9D4BV42_DREPO|nr:hypothetical protein DPMN_070443 [Dreissena polymorpha]